MNLAAAARAATPTLLLRISIAVAVVTILMKTAAWLLTDSVGGIDGLHRLGITPTRVAAKLPEILGHVDDRQTRYDRYRAAR